MPVEYCHLHDFVVQSSPAVLHSDVIKWRASFNYNVFFCQRKRASSIRFSSLLYLKAVCLCIFMSREIKVRINCCCQRSMNLETIKHNIFNWHAALAIFICFIHINNISLWLRYTIVFGWMYSKHYQVKYINSILNANAYITKKSFFFLSNSWVCAMRPNFQFWWTLVQTNAFQILFKN